LSPTRNKSATPKVDTAHSHPKPLIVCAPCTPSQWIAHLPSHPRFGHQSIIAVTKQFSSSATPFAIIHVVFVSFPAINNTLPSTASIPFCQ
jgi:hypothetical protein